MARVEAHYPVDDHAACLGNEGALRVDRRPVSDVRIGSCSWADQERVWGRNIPGCYEAVGLTEGDHSTAGKAHRSEQPGVGVSDRVGPGLHDETHMLRR